MKPDIVSERANWDMLKLQFSDLKDLLRMRFETKEEAVGEKVGGKWENRAPRWEDPEIGTDVKAWLLVPYVEGIDQERLQENIREAKELVPLLEEYFQAEILSLAFLKLWGAFCSRVGVVQFLYFSETYIARGRIGAAGRNAFNLDAQRRWMSHYIVKRSPKHGELDNIRNALESLVISIVEGKRPPPGGFDIGWFKVMVSLDDTDSKDSYYKLTRTFWDLSLTQMKRLANSPKDDLPPIDIEIPEA